MFNTGEIIAESGRGGQKKIQIFARAMNYKRVLVILLISEEICLSKSFSPKR
jgi:hypothetical protein